MRTSALARPTSATIALLAAWLVTATPRLSGQEPDPPPAGEDPAARAAVEASARGWLHGRLALRYLHRDADLDERDQDLYQYLSLRGGNPRHDAVTARVYLRGAWDVDGRGLGPTGSSLSSLEDAKGGEYDLLLYDGYLSFHRILEGGEIRLGRQNFFDTPILLHLDGLSVRAPVSLGDETAELHIYGGIPEHRWEAARDGDAAAGMALSFSPWHDGMLRLDAMYLEDQNLFGEPSNTLLGARLSQVSLDGRAFASAAASLLDGDFRDASAQASWASADSRWQWFGSARFLLSRQAANTLEFDPFTAILLEEQPYAEGQLSLSHYLLEDPDDDQVRVDLGVYGRELRDSGAESTFNREFNRYWAGVGLEEIPWEPLETTLTGEIWDSGADKLATAGIDLTAQLSSAARVSVGSAYALYKFDFFSGTERDRVRDYYLRWRQELSERLRLTLDFQYEEDDVEDFQVGSLFVEVMF